MDRQIIYPGQIPLDTDLLDTNKNAMIAIGKLASAALGVNGVVHGLAVTPTSPASLNVNVAPGSIYMVENVDNTSYGSLAADTTNQIVKQGILLAGTQLNCPAPGTGGQSINYLIQAAFSEVDSGSVALPYYNASNPSVAWSGPNNTGTPQATSRQDLCVVTVKAGAAATTGSQVTPTPDAGNIALAVVGVANGQATITASNIVQSTGASLVPQDGLASNVMHSSYTKNVAGAANVTLTAQEAAFPILTLTGTLTGNIQVIVPATVRQRVINNQTTGGFSVTIITAAGTGIVATQGYAIPTYCDGTNVNSSVSALLTQASADARYSPFAAGHLIMHTGTSAPTGYLQCPTAATNISRTTYAALFAAIGTTWGAGDGSTTFGMPWFPAGYAPIHNTVGIGGNSAGAVISHTHTDTGHNHSQNAHTHTDSGHQHGWGYVAGSQNTGSGSPPAISPPASTNMTGVASAAISSTTATNNAASAAIAATGGTVNSAAGVYVMMCVKY